MVDMMAVLVILLSFTTLTGWLTAWYQKRRADIWEEKYIELRDKRFDELKRALMAGVGSSIVEKIGDTFDL